MSLTGSPDGPPFKLGISIADVTTGMYAVHGILAALYQRQSTGKGQKIDVALLDSMVSTLTYQAGIYFGTGRVPQRMGNRHPSIVPYETFETADGYLTIGVTNDAQWHRFCEAIGLKDLEKDERYLDVPHRVKNYEALRAVLACTFQQNTIQHWLGKLRAAGIPCGEVRTVAGALEEPQLKAREMIVELDHPKAGRIRATGLPIKMSGGRPARPSPPPTLGQHNRQVFCGILGLSDREFESLEREGVT